MTRNSRTGRPANHPLRTARCVLMLCGCVLSPSVAQSPVFPEGLDPETAFLARISGLFSVEDPSSFYSFDIRDEAVEFILDGTWETRLDGAAAISFDGGTPVIAASPPVFSQTVDLSSWIFINRTWYFESSFAEQFTKNTVAAGYTGNDETPVKHVRLGNSGIVFPGTYPFVRIGGGAAIAPGVMGTFAGDTWSADAIVRYDTAASRLLVLSGMNEITDTYIPITALNAGKWFVLPHAPVTGTVSVYVTDDNGSVRDTEGRRWRELNAAEFRVSGIAGTVELVQETNENVAVVYDGDFGSAGSASASLTGFIDDTRFYFDSIDGALDDAYLPTGIENGYVIGLAGESALLVRERGYFSPFADHSRYRAEGTDLAAVFSESGIRFDSLGVAGSDGTWMQLYRTVDPRPTADTEGSRSPETRYPLAPEFPRLYLPSFGGGKPDTDLSIRSRSFKPLTSISLGADAIAGTVQVTRDGIPDTAFRFDENSGQLTLDKIPGGTETIRITWLDTDPAARNATLTLAGGVEWRPGPAISATTASALRWNVSKNGYTNYADSSPGSLILSNGISWTGNDLSAATAFAFDLTVYDTTGFYRILGMESTPAAFYPGDDWYEATPEDIEPVLGAPEYDSTPASITLPYGKRVPQEGTEGDRLRTVSNPDISGSILALSCDLSSPGSWTSAEILTGTKGNADFRAAKQVEMAIKNTSAAADFEIYLQLGTGASDFFEDPDTVRTWRLSTPAAGSSWVVKQISLTDEDRSALGSGANIRIILYSPDGSAGSVGIYTGPIEISGSDFSATAVPAMTSPTNLSVREIRESGATLASAEPELVRKFNTGGINTVLEITFTPDVATQSISVSRNIPVLPLWKYDKLSFFVKPDGNSHDTGQNATVTLSRPAEGGHGMDTALTLTVPAGELSAAAWQEITVDLRKRTVSRNGTLLSGATVELDRSVQPTHASLIFENWPNGTAYTILVDEFYLAETEPEYTGRNESSVAWKKQGPVFSAGKIPVVSDAAFSITSLSSISTTSSDPFVSGTAKTGFTLLKTKIEAALTASTSPDRVVDSTTHSLSVPLGPLSAIERFSVDFTGNTFRHENTLAVSGPVSAGATTGVRFTGRNLERDALFKLTPAIPLTSIGLFGVGADSAFSQTGVSPVAHADTESWSDLWTDSFFWSLSTGESDAAKRTGKTAAWVGWEAPRNDKHESGLSGVRIDTEALSDYRSGTATVLGSTVSYTLSVPFRAGLATITPSWQRTAGQNRAERQAGGSYATDTEFLGSSIAVQDWLFSVAPFADLFDPDIAGIIRDDGVHSRSFSNRYGILWKRPSPGRLSDLWLPSTFDTSVKRDTATDASAANIEDGYTATAKTGFSALNIAGSFGILQLFPWYEQDEIAQLYGWTSKWGTGYFTWSADTLHSVMLFFPSGGTLVAENAWHYDSPSIAGTGELVRDTVRLIWKRNAKTSFAELIARRWTKAALTTKREDSATFSITHTETASTSLAYDHTEKTSIGKNGEILLTGGTGFTRNGDYPVSMQLRLGIGGKLTY